TISKPDFARCFRLVELTSSEVYKTSVFGWRPRAKRAEMRKNGMRYLLVRPESLDSTDAIAFLSFLPVEEQSPQTTAPFIALYVYEVHVDPSCQSKGLGKRLMRVAEGIAARIGARKVMLTVFEENEGGRRFYDREGYAVDEVSP
ncbi:acyl-CoA N-acyltransferase, partial [Eremomyces bilateralis CBS 781.70]